jgi:hypothetical protein
MWTDMYRGSMAVVAAPLDMFSRAANVLRRGFVATRGLRFTAPGRAPSQLAEVHAAHSASYQL